MEVSRPNPMECAADINPRSSSTAYNVAQVPSTIADISPGVVTKVTVAVIDVIMIGLLIQGLPTI